MLREEIAVARLIYESAKSWKSAERDFKTAIRLSSQQPPEPGFSDLYNSPAWPRATCPEKGLRNGHEAVSLALRACALSHWKDQNTIDTLAAAYAENRNFERAAAFQEEAMWMDGVDERLRKEMADRVSLYQRGAPYRQETAE